VKVTESDNLNEPFQLRLRTFLITAAANAGVKCTNTTPSQHQATPSLFYLSASPICSLVDTHGLTWLLAFTVLTWAG
jgi:hypothetical protein